MLLDFGIMIDVFELVINENWLFMLEFVLVVVDFFDIFIRGIYIGFIVFSCDVVIMLYFNIL